MKAVEKLPLPLLLPLCVTEVVRIGSIIIFPLSIFRANARTGLTMYILAPWNRQPTDNQKTTNRQLTDCRFQGEKVQMNQIVKEIRHPPVRMWCVDYCRIHPTTPPVPFVLKKLWYWTCSAACIFIRSLYFGSSKRLAKILHGSKAIRPFHMPKMFNKIP